MADKAKVINKFYGGIVRDDKSRIQGGASNIEELDIYSNADYIQPEQIFSADSLPASTEVYAYTADSSDIVYGYGKETAGNKVRIVSVADGGSDNPGAFATLFTSADTTNLAYAVSPIQFHKTTEANSKYLYYCAKTAGNSVVLQRYDITGGTESTVGTLTGLTGSFDRISMKVIFGELIITNGQYMARVDKDGVFTNAAFTLPNNWIAVDFEAVSDVCIIISRNINRLINYSKGYWWDLTSATQVDDSFDLPKGGPQWIYNHKETIKMFCAQNGTGRFYQLSGAFPGAVPIELPGIYLTNIAAETSTQPISPAKTVGTKDNILYFGLYKTDKSGLYAIGQLDSDKPTALILSKRFNTTSYASHKPTGVLIQGPNFYAAYDDNGTASVARCESNNSPSRSSNAVYESIWIDDGDPSNNKTLKTVFLTSYPLAASTSMAVSVASDYGSYTSYTRPDGTAFNTTNGLVGFFNTPGEADKKLIKIKVAFTSSGTNGPKLTGIGFVFSAKDKPANK